MNRRAELQRKLEETPAPQPPAGLAERIKNDIPDDLRFDVEDERERFGDAIALNMRVAASILVLIATAFLALRIVSHAPSGPEAPAAMRAAKRAVERTDTFASAPPPSTAVLQIPETPAPPKQKKRVAVAVTRPATPPPAVETVAGNTIADAASAPSPMPPPPPPPAAAAPQSITVTEAAPAVAQRAATVKVVAEAITVRDDSIVQRYAAPAALPAGVALDVEATDDPLTPHRVIVRVSLDAGSTASNVSVDVMLTPPVANAAQWLANSWKWSAERFASGSRTTLVEFPLPDTDEPLAQIHARYTDATGVTNVEKMIRRADVTRWNAASPRMKAASLAALWQHGADRTAVANAARAAGRYDLAAEIEGR